MRTVAELPHPDFKITIFAMNQKFIIKFEQGPLEQSYMIAETALIDGVNDVFQILDESFYSTVLKQFEEMRKSFNEAYARYDS